MPQPEARKAKARPSETRTKDDFTLFQNVFVQAIRFDDQAQAKALRQPPLLFGGNQIEANRFGDLWKTLLLPQTTACLAQSKALREAGGSRSHYRGNSTMAARQ
jgi:hypothetical protein